MLNHKRVELIRTSGKSDRHWANLWRMTEAAIRMARKGVTWADHPTPPDTKSRQRGGSRRLHTAETSDVARALASMKPPGEV